MAKANVSSVSVSPSMQGSSPVRDVLNRLLVRDSHHKPNGIVGRRMADYESATPLLQTAMFFALAAFIMGGLGSMYLPTIVKAWNSIPAVSTSRTKLIPEEHLRIPTGIHPVARVREWTVPTPRVQAQTGPENLHARFMGPRMLEFLWDSLGEGYAYQVYAADNPQLDGAQPVTQKLVPTTSLSWMPEANVDTAWIAVRGIDPAGHATAFSDPLAVSLAD